MNAQIKKSELPFSFLKGFLHLFSFDETTLEMAKDYIDINSGTDAIRRDWKIIGSDLKKSMNKIDQELELNSSKLECVE